ncbi:MAG: hypothetical protein IPM29_31350 [Planctomycetes bacterium]|nr:hypothetical protein [Planctomycetota bacterium]
MKATSLIGLLLAVLLLAIVTAGCATSVPAGPSSWDPSGPDRSALALRPVDRSAGRATAGDAAFLSAPLASPGHAGNVRQGEGGAGGSFSVLLGARHLDEDYWDPLENQGVLGIEAEFRPGRSPLGIEFGGSVSANSEDDYLNSGIDLAAAIAEFYVGPRLTANTEGSVRPYVGGGVTLLTVAAEGRTTLGGVVIDVDDDDASAAAYLHAGLQADLTRGLHLGFDVRGVFGSDITLFGASGDADYIQLALSVGANW